MTVEAVEPRLLSSNPSAIRNRRYRAVSKRTVMLRGLCDQAIAAYLHDAEGIPEEVDCRVSGLLMKIRELRRRGGR